MLQRDQRGVGGVEDDTLGRRHGIGDARGVPDILLQERTGDGRELVCPANVTNELAALMADYARRVFDVLGCRDVARLDFRADAEGIPHLLEINPIPGLTPYGSALPRLAQVAGISPEEGIHQLVRNALARRA